MKRSHIFAALLLLLPFLFSSCDYQRPLAEEDLMFIGTWSSHKWYIEIAANGRGYWERRNRPGHEGTVRITYDRIIFSAPEDRESFRIEELPFYDENSGFTIMVLDNQEFYLH
ncbi:MAG: hypothetical protein GY705_05300 [Bacteroidetes bacterium]|nr:hypothetical protein [Bacteroidota bacterium]